MNGGRIITRLRAIRRWIEARLPAPMAAPETPRLRRLRLTLVVQLALLAVLTAAWEPIVWAGARLAAAILWLGLALACGVVGVVWLTAKIRADEAWLVREREE